MKKLIYSTEKVLNKVNSVMEVFTGYVIFAFMVLLFFQVVMRFVFKHPIYGIDEAVTALMICPCVLVGARFTGIMDMQSWSSL